MWGEPSLEPRTGHSMKKGLVTVGHTVRPLRGVTVMTYSGKIAHGGKQSVICLFVPQRVALLLA